MKLKYLLFMSIIYCFAVNNYAETVNQFKDSWLASALKLQREIDINTPLNEATFLGTHNSYNSKAYQIPLLRYVDPNQMLSIYDQLELGIRSIELDAHWTKAKHSSHDILLCHGLPSHSGCSMFDRKITEALSEIKKWLKDNPKEILLLYIERHLDDHEPRLAYQLESKLGDFIFKPSSIRKNDDKKNSCIALPSNITKNDILKAHKQLIIVTKHCDGSDHHYKEENKYKQFWNDFVFAGIGDIPGKPYTFLDNTISYFTNYPDCGKLKIFFSDVDHTSMWRVFENETFLGKIIKNEKAMQPDDMRELMKCDINWPTLDKLIVDDNRLLAAIWSWAPHFPSDTAGQCAFYKKDVGIMNTSCDEIINAYACRLKGSQKFKAIAVKSVWKNGEDICRATLGDNWYFSVPINGYQMNSLKDSALESGLNEIWLNYKKNQKNHWIANA